MSTSVRRTGAARQRLLDAALALFTERGVNGTSLQMIADALGVTKAAVYHQFPSKDEIVLAVIAPAVDQLRALVAAADAAPTPAAGREIVLEGMTGLVVAHRRLAAVLLVDRTVAYLLRDVALGELEARIDRHLAGADPTPEVRVAVAMVGASIMNIGIDQRLQDLDDETLRENILLGAHRLLGIRSTRRSRPVPPASRGVSPASGTAHR